MRIDETASRCCGSLLSSSVREPRLERGATGDVRLIEAVKSGNAAAVQTLSRQRALVNAAEADGTTALHWAARLDRVELVQTLHSRRRAGQRAEPLRRHAAGPGRRQRQRGRSSMRC